MMKRESGAKISHTTLEGHAVAAGKLSLGPCTEEKAKRKIWRSTREKESSDKGWGKISRNRDMSSEIFKAERNPGGE